jgi:hypothetical protein
MGEIGNPIGGEVDRTIQVGSSRVNGRIIIMEWSFEKCS